MTTTTTNYGWTIPSDTDLVTNGASAMRTLGQGIDTSLVGLKGGTTGQILSKTSGTDMAFTWITNDVGDITAVTTTAPLQGGASSGAVALTVDAASTTAAGVVQLSNSTSTTSSILAATPTAVKSAYDLADAAIAKTTITTAGDVIYRNATVPTRLGIGTAGQVLTVNSGATAPQWSTPAGGGGKVLQVVYGSTSTSTSISSTSFTDTTLTASITPTVNTSKIMILTSLVSTLTKGGTGVDGLGQKARIMRDATAVFTQPGAYQSGYFNPYTTSTGYEVGWPVVVNYLDSPATTSSTTYKLQIALNNTTFSAASICQHGSGISTIILLEIGA